MLVWHTLYQLSRVPDHTLGDSLDSQFWARVLAAWAFLEQSFSNLESSGVLHLWILSIGRNVSGSREAGLHTADAQLSRLGPW